jgi:hypothetical protein
MRLLKQAVMIAAVMFLALIGFGPAIAFAQDVAGGVIVTGESTFLQQLVAALLPALGVILTALAGWAATELHRRTGITIEAGHRQALQSALLNGILFALQRAGWVQGQPLSSSILPDLLPSARNYVESSVPDALKKFGIDTGTAAGKAALDRLLTPKLPIAVGTVMPNGDTLVGRLP